MTISTNLQRFRSLPEGAVIHPSTGRVLAIAQDIAQFLGVSNAAITYCRDARVEPRFVDLELLLSNFAKGHGKLSRLAKEILI